MLKENKVGSKIDTTNFIFETYDINYNDLIYNRIINKSYRENDYIKLSDLSYVLLTHYNYNNEIVIGELVINKIIVEDIKKVFEYLFNIKYQINSIRLIDDFWDEDPIKSDRKSILNNNSSSFNFRKIPNSDRISLHSYGIAIDINPLDNPYAQKVNGEYNLSELTPYEVDVFLNRGKYKNNPHVIKLDDELCKIFNEVGFECGGIWPTRDKNYSCDWQHFEPNDIKKEKIMKEINK